ncbi:filamentous hemagglutinin N-terminal domain-containing protein [Pseudoteredinibacter isoporae]|uniref:Filamentous hemagglutinin family protein n=1 Tax=Pseudoteredinibacter isoporae TaxID=570281 RepID=A0A7X0JS03_9GAMM|nr:filamentous hemagglutinin N-terminal domain-containing protein [Pseudoteredinibacter isoporae]MBB6521092.1 filamentous hemagglutinin family protein [Pseudoteredinibacter isoporae]NHO86656.1 filamentous hemagglutinin N-terminal domain-containing protein [Pseudoteredinibacter isoporae]NIB24892.1 filamentous hemagglutinin N-terminal domain-containing protein [Pseudoteredinibacter isoporae]
MSAKYLHLKPIFRVASKFFFCSCFSATTLSANTVVPDGSTETSVRQHNGITEIQIAPANDDRTSYNRYTRFDVSRDGVALNNRDVAARTIVNEVTGGKLSTIAGQIEVLGTRAHLVIANTNGISVDGVSFINTADTILTTGVVSSVERQLGPGLSQLNTLLDTNAGTIVIGEGGLSGAMSSLDLIAQSIEINGVIHNIGVGRRNQVRLFAGESLTELDSSLSPSNPTRSVALVQQKKESHEGILIRMSDQGSIDSGSILIGVNAKGAGVKLAGNLIARSGNFLLSADGAIRSTASIRSAGRIALKSSDDIHFESNLDSEQAEVSAGNGISIETPGKFSSEGVLISASIDERTLPALDFGPYVDPATLPSIDIQAGEGMEFTSLDGDHLSILFAANGAIKLQSPGDIVNRNGRMISNGAINIQTSGKFQNLLSYTEFDGRGEIQHTESQGSRRWYTLFLKREKRRETWADFGKMLIEGELPTLVADGNLSINAGHIDNIGGDFISNGGDINLVANTIHNEAIALGELRFNSRCVISCDQHGSSSVQLYGGGIKAANDSHLNARESFYNLGGTVFSVANTQITTPSLRNEAITIPNVFQRPKGLAGFFSHRTGRVFRQDQGGALIANMGRLVINSDADVSLVGGLLQGGDDEEMPENITIVRERLTQSPVTGESIGIFGKGL